MASEYFDAALQLWIADIRSHDAVEGALVSGSYVTGTPGPYSDLDLQVLLTAPSPEFPPWSTRQVQGVELEIFADTFEYYEEHIRERKDIRGSVHPLAVGRILFDKRGRLALLKRQAEAAIQELSAQTAPGPEAKDAAVRPLLFGFRKMGNAMCRNDETAFEFEYGFLLHLASTQFLAAAGYRLARNPVADLERLLPRIHALFLLCLSAKTMEEKWSRFTALMERAFADLALGDLPKPLSAD